MRPVDFYASQAHYRHHLLPLWWALPPEARGRWYSPNARVRNALAAEGVPAHQQAVGKPTGPPRLAVVASGGDARLLRPRPVVLVEHGAGQVYDEDSPSYSGGCQRDNVVLFLCPSPVVAGRNAARYPEARVQVVGSPWVDHLRATVASSGVAQLVAYRAHNPAAAGSRPAPATGHQPRQGHGAHTTVALSFHWDCKLAPEAGWALPHYREALPELVRTYSAVGHGHPRFHLFFYRLWASLGIPHVADFAHLPAVADVYVCDNSSTLYEWAALDRPVVVLNAPWYRRDADLWPRFWRCADVGVQVDEAGSLAAAVAQAMADPPEVAARRREVVAEVYGQLDGQAAARSAAAILAAVS